MDCLISWKNLLLAGIAFLLAVLFQTNADAEEKVVYKVVNSANANVVLRGIDDHLEASKNKPSIVVVAEGKGVDFLVEGAKDEDGKPYQPRITTLGDNGVQFRVCGTTLKSRRIDPKIFLPEAKVVPSSSKEIERLKDEGFVVMR